MPEQREPSTTELLYKIDRIDRSMQELARRIEMLEKKPDYSKAPGISQPVLPPRDRNGNIKK